MRGHHRAILESQFQQTVNLLAADETLPQRYHDHALTGNWEGYRDCHFRFDLVLIYRKLDGELLELTRLGSHSELGL
jgi:mRNA interferase YafQ